MNIASQHRVQELESAFSRYRSCSPEAARPKTFPLRMHSSVCPKLLDHTTQHISAAEPQFQ